VKYLNVIDDTSISQQSRGSTFKKSYDSLMTILAILCDVRRSLRQIYDNDNFRKFYDKFKNGLNIVNMTKCINVSMKICLCYLVKSSASI